MDSITKLLVRQVYREYYRDFGVYRWLNRNKQTLRWLFGIPFLPVCIFGMFDVFLPLMVWAFSFIGIIWAAGIDHFYIGLRLRKILRKLEAKGVSINLYLLNEICQYEAPQ
jgi:hypothetical protein